MKVGGQGDGLEGDRDVGGESEEVVEEEGSVVGQCADGGRWRELGGEESDDGVGDHYEDGGEERTPLPYS